MEKQKKTTRPDNQNKETRTGNETDFTEMICIKTYQFENQDVLTEEAVSRPDIFLKCCCSFFNDMISCAEEDCLSPHPDALGMAEKGSLLFWDLDLAFSYGVIQDAFAAAQEAAKAVIIKKMYETKPKD